MSKPFDKRSSFFNSYFQKALPYNDFLKASDPNHQRKWQEFESLIKLSEQQASTLSSFNRKMNVLCLAGSWCGDCARQCPIINIISKAALNFNFRLIDNRSNPELADELRICGGMRVPTVIVLSEDFFEVSRFGDRTLSAYRRKAIQELGPACDSGLVPPSKNELELEVADWVEYFERAQLMLRLSPLLRARYND